MPTKIVRQPEHVDALATILKARKMPMTVSWVQGAPRTGAQNRLLHRWYGDISRQVGDTPFEEVRATCKLVFGIPIMRRDSEEYDRIIGRQIDHLSFEQRVEVIRVLDIPVTRTMVVKQMTECMEAVQQYWTRRGIRLTDPEAMKYEQEFE